MTHFAINRSKSQVHNLHAGWSLLFAGVFFSACGSSSFGGSTKKSSGAAAPATPVSTKRDDGNTQPKIPGPGGAIGFTETFPIVTKARPVDVIWVVDNSGSMSEEIRQVRVNFEKFTTQLQSQVDAKMILVSKTSRESNPSRGPSGSDLGLSLPAGLANSYQLDTPVGSYNLYPLLLTALCDTSRADLRAKVTDENKDSAFGKPTSDPSGMLFIGSARATTSFCGAPMKINGRLEPFTSDIAGKLAPQLRPEASKMFVFVSDEMEKAVASSDFLAKMKDIFPTTPFSVLSFVKQATPTSDLPSAISNGWNYRELATLIGSETFDIDAADWSPHFEKLLKRSTEIASTRFKLARTAAKKVTMAKIDGKVIDSALVTVRDGHIELSPGVIQAGQKELVVQLE